MVVGGMAANVSKQTDEYQDASKNASFIDFHPFLLILANWFRTDQPTDRPMDGLIQPLIEMRGRI